MTSLYRTTGVLIHEIETPANVALAQAYLRSDDMTEYVKHSDLADPSVVFHIEWSLDGDGLHWAVNVITTRDLTDEESKQLSSWISGQNSDGLGEGFEQQEFAELINDEYDEHEDGHWMMCSFDWETNDCLLEKIK